MCAFQAAIQLLSIYALFKKNMNKYTFLQILYSHLCIWKIILSKAGNRTHILCVANAMLTIFFNKKILLLYIVSLNCVT